MAKWALFALALGGFAYGVLWVTGRGDNPTTPKTVVSTPLSTTVAFEPVTSTTGASTTTTTVATTTSTTTTTVAPERLPSEVTVLVLNSTGRVGLAAAVTAQLKGSGYQTLAPANYAGDSLPVSVVWYAPGSAAEAFTLAALVPDARVEPYPEGEPPADIVVVLGASYQG